MAAKEYSDLSGYLECSGAPLAQLSRSCTDKDLATIAEAIDEWETLAPHLGVLKPQQTAIKRDYPGQTVKQKQEMLWKWKARGGIDATYMNLCRVFWSLEKTNLVDKVCDCVRSTPPHSGPPMLMGSQKRPRDREPEGIVALRRPSDDTCPQPAYYGPLKVCKVTRHPARARIEEVKREVCKLDGQFQDLEVKTRRVVNLSMAKDSETFREDFVCRLLSIDSAKKPLHQRFLEHKIEEGAESIESILRALSSYWNFINSDLLEHIITKILDDADLQQRLRSYLIEKHSFCELTKVCEFEAAKTKLPVLLPQFEVPRDLSVIVLQVVRDWADYTIAQALATWQSIAEEIQVGKIVGFFAGATPSNSVNLVWAVPPDAVSLIAEALTNPHIREKNEIKAVCIDGKLLDTTLRHELYPRSDPGTGQQGREAAMDKEGKKGCVQEEIPVTPDQISAITAVITTIPKLIYGVQELTKAVAAAVDDAYADLDSTREAEVKHNSKVRFAYGDIQTAAEKALRYVELVDDIFDYSRDKELLRKIMEQLAIERTEIRQGRRNWRRLWLRRHSYVVHVPAPEYQLLKERIDHLKRSFARVEEVYLEFKESIREAIKSTNNAAEECKHKATQAKSQQEKTAWKGGVATAATALVLGGLAAATGGLFGVVAGVGAVGIAAGGTAVTYSQVQQYEQLEKAFDKHYTNLEQLAKEGSEIEESALQVRQALEELATAVDDIEYSQQNRESVESLCHYLERMRAKFDEGTGVISQCHSTIKDKKDELKRKQQNF